MISRPDVARTRSAYSSYVGQTASSSGQASASSVPASVLAVTGIRAPRSETTALGCASRLSAQAGCRRCPQFELATRKSVPRFT